MTRAGRRIAIWAVSLIVALVVLAGAYIVTYGPVCPITTAQPIARAMQIDEATIELGFDCTHGPSNVDRLEETDRITVEIRAPSHSDDFASGHNIELEKPLGDRILIDGATGERVEVQGRLVPESAHNPRYVKLPFTPPTDVQMSWIPHGHVGHTRGIAPFL